MENYGLGIFAGLTWSYLRILHNGADFSLTTSPQLCEEIIQNGFQRIGLWRKGIDTDVFNPSKQSAEMRFKLTNGHPEDPLIINVGRLGNEKNLPSFKELLRRLPNTRLALVGDGPIREELEELLEGTNTYFAGMLKGEELSAAFASADVFVMPSVTETMGFVALESMASGVPVVGARAGGIPDMVQHQKTGYLFEPHSIDECETYVRKLLNNPQQRQEMGNASRQEAFNWAWTASAAATRNIGYGRAISNFYLSNTEETIPIRLACFLGNNIRKNSGNDNA